MGKRLKGYTNTYMTFPGGQSLCFQYAYTKSQSAIGRAQSSMYNGMSRHIHRRHNTIRQLLSTGVISIDFVKSKDNIADPLTKGLNGELVEKSSKGMRLKPTKE